MESTIDRIETTDQVVFDAYYMTLPEFVNYYRDINGFALRSQGGTHNLDELYYDIIKQVLDGKRKINRELRKSSHSKWLRENNKPHTTRPYADILSVPTDEEEVQHEKHIVRKRSEQPPSGRALKRAQHHAKGAIVRNRSRLGERGARPTTSKATERKKLTGRKAQVKELLDKGWEDAEKIAKKLGTNKSYVQRIIKEING